MSVFTKKNTKFYLFNILIFLIFSISNIHADLYTDTYEAYKKFGDGKPLLDFCNDLSKKIEGALQANNQHLATNLSRFLSVTVATGLGKGFRQATTQEIKRLKEISLKSTLIFASIEDKRARKDQFYNAMTEVSRNIAGKPSQLEELFYISYHFLGLEPELDSELKKAPHLPDFTKEFKHKNDPAYFKHLTEGLPTHAHPPKVDTIIRLKDEMIRKAKELGITNPAIAINIDLILKATKNKEAILKKITVKKIKSPNGKGDCFDWQDTGAGNLLNFGGMFIEQSDARPLLSQVMNQHLKKKFNKDFKFLGPASNGYDPVPIPSNYFVYLEQNLHQIIEDFRALLGRVFIDQSEENLIHVYHLAQQKGKEAVFFRSAFTDSGCFAARMNQLSQVGSDLDQNIGIDKKTIEEKTKTPEDVVKLLVPEAFKHVGHDPNTIADWVADFVSNNQITIGGSSYGRDYFRSQYVVPYLETLSLM